MKEYTFSYRFDGKSWSLSIWADSVEEAKAKFRAACDNAKYDGEVLAKIHTPVNVTLVRKVLKWFKNLTGSKK
ncbi:hypothetical protein EGK75_07440 [Neisseria weixii]|uniref:Uncharacterized protein n=1 Tax=Neisseria weixii TaxID=1853276 RepID=A0A3N4N4F9_9NEIS|nr:hypothetical protein EGK74_08155 [Neisseria weixii]RPD87192.1 hypothetical protein EGK75_07440 [Neisseria weixii]